MNRRGFGRLSTAAAFAALTDSARAQTRAQTVTRDAKKSAAHRDKLRIAILLYDKMTVLDAIGPYEVLSRLPNARVYFVGETAGLKRADTGFLSLNADYTLDQITDPDVLLLPGGDARGPMASRKVLDWVLTAHKTTKYTASICTGAFILGAAGLLKGQRATTWWASAEMLTREFGAEYVAERYVQTGKIITAAGVSAGIDAGLFLAEKLTDRRTAQMLQLVIEYNPQPHIDSGSPRKADEQTVEAARRYFVERRRRQEGR